MTNLAAQTSTQPPCIRRSIGAIILGFVAVAVLSLGTDEVLHLLNVYPPWGEPMYDPRLNLLALSYRIVYTILAATSLPASRLAIPCVTPSFWE